MSDDFPPTGGDGDPDGWATPPRPSPWGPPPAAGGPSDPVGEGPPGSWSTPGVGPGAHPGAYPGQVYARNSQAVAALVVSILGLFLCCGPLSLVSLVMARADMKAIDRGQTDPGQRGMATAAFVISIIVVIGWALIVLFYGAAVLFAIASSG